MPGARSLNGWVGGFEFLITRNTPHNDPNLPIAPILLPTHCNYLQHHRIGRIDPIHMDRSDFAADVI